MKLSSKFDSETKKSIVNLSLIQWLNYLMPLIILPLLIKRLGYDGVGVIAVFTAFVGFFSVLIDYGFGYWGTERVVKKGGGVKAFHVVNNITIAKLIIFSFIFLPFFYSFNFFVSGVEATKNIPIFIGLSIVFLNCLNVAWYFNAICENGIMICGVALSKLVQLFYIFYFVINESDVIQVLWAHFFSIFILISVQWFYLIKVKKWKFSGAKWRLMFFYLTSSSYLFVTNFILNFFANCSALIMKMLGVDVESIGIFNSVEKIMKAAQSLFAPFSTAITPFFLRKKNKGMNLRNEILNLCFLTFVIALFFCFSICFILFFVSSHIVFLGDILENFHIVLFLSPWFVFAIVNNILGTQGVLVNFGKKFYSQIIILFGFFSIFLMFIFTRFFGVEGFAFSISLGEVLLFVWLYFVFRRE